MHHSHILSAALLGTTTNAATLYATHYSGTINKLNLDGSSLTLVNSISTGNILPSWITYDNVGKALYVPDEVFFGASSGTLTSFFVGSDGTLKDIGKGPTKMGVVATTLYGGANGTSFIANAHYQTSQVSTFKLPLTGAQPFQTLQYTMSGPGKIPSRQEAPHPHHVFTDPTGEFLVVTDLGADIIRINRIDRSSGKLTECGTGKPTPGTGPRHGTFWGSGENTTLFVANELSNSVSGWKVNYPQSSTGCLTLTLRDTLTPYQGNLSAPTGTKVGEIHVKDNFVYVSNRNDKKFSGNDSLTQYTIGSDGKITWTANTSSFGTYPRTFDISNTGDYVAIGDQTTSNVAIVRRNKSTGRLGDLVASLRIGAAGTPESEDGLSAVVWTE
ncbi:Lactonase, 7-bladed beta-propeller-domain-containing protein [Boeremia exigua]|uniref:Lactonase, 7-bladed beta-propeller-domain-containing protein n=1 Tax=Boeremia exigua TaxID=749465 RepID=UPI001E8DAB2F|nr:Lactonase, 7-bladed beta-propeller-domain-containing protein [Boeremia exigua]KAH6644457.1 Lactonase, 7-bladed beta-propeller-domain-containing protein [Boeremia exigua]